MNMDVMILCLLWFIFFTLCYRGVCMWFLKGKHLEGQMTVTGKGEERIRIHFHPKDHHIHFTDHHPHKPSCAPCHEDWVFMEVCDEAIIISWHVSEPRKIRWYAKR